MWIFVSLKRSKGQTKFETSQIFFKGERQNENTIFHIFLETEFKNVLLAPWKIF